MTFNPSETGDFYMALWFITSINVEGITEISRQLLTFVVHECCVLPVNRTESNGCFVNLTSTQQCSLPSSTILNGDHYPISIALGQSVLNRTPTRIEWEIFNAATNTLVSTQVTSCPILYMPRGTVSSTTALAPGTYIVRVFITLEDCITKFFSFPFVARTINECSDTNCGVKEDICCE